MADEPTWDGAGGDSAADPAARRPQPVEGPPTAAAGTPHVTVDELLARTGSGVRRRRAERREATGRQQRVDGYGAPAVRPDPPAVPARPVGGPPPVPRAVPAVVPPGRPSTGPRSDRPAVPPASGLPTPRAQVPVPPVPVPPRASRAEPDSPRWVPGVDRPAVPAAQPRSGGTFPGRDPQEPRRVSPGDLPLVPRGSSAVVGARAAAAVLTTPELPETGAWPRPAAPRRLTPIEEEWAGTGHPSLPLPDTGVRRSMPIPPIPGLDRPMAGAHDLHDDPVPPRGGSTSAGLRVQRTPRGPVRRRLTRAAMALLLVLGVVAAYYVGLYFYVDRSIDRVDALVTDGPEVLAPQLQNAAQTYLVVGTGLPGRSGPASVSTLIAHISEDGERAVLVTVPPTALTDTPACRSDDGSVREPITEPFAAALLAGGPSCLVRSVQQLSGLRIDHYLGLDLASLPGMVEALDGVSVCLPGGVATDSAGLSLPAGYHDLSGDQVIAYLSPGSAGADVVGTTAAEREQLVLTSTLRSAMSGGTLADPLTLTRFLSRAGAALTVDADTTLGDVRALGATLGDLSGDAVQRTAVPVSRIGYVPAGTDRATALVDGSGARELFDAVIDDGRMPATASTPTGVPLAPATAAAPAGGPAADSLPDPAMPDPALSDPAPADPVPEGATVTVAPAGVSVDVLDATSAGRAGTVAQGLAAVGFRTAAVGSEPAAVNETVVRYGPESLEPARTVAAAVPGAVLIESDQVGGGVQLVLGPGDPTVTPVDIGTPVPAAAAPAVSPAAGDVAACN